MFYVDTGTLVGYKGTDPHTGEHGIVAQGVVLRAWNAPFDTSTGRGGDRMANIFWYEGEKTACMNFSKNENLTVMASVL